MIFFLQQRHCFLKNLLDGNIAHRRRPAQHMHAFARRRPHHRIGRAEERDNRQLPARRRGEVSDARVVPEIKRPLRAAPRPGSAAAIPGRAGEGGPSTRRAKTARAPHRPRPRRPATQCPASPRAGAVPTPPIFLSASFSIRHRCPDGSRRSASPSSIRRETRAPPWCLPPSEKPRSRHRPLV